MYLWNAKALAEELRQDKVTEKESMKYLLVNMLLWTNSLFSTPPNESWIDWCSSGALLLITILAIIWCFKANQQGDNKDFVKRFTCLSVPIGVRFVAIIVLFFLIWIILSVAFGDKSVISPGILQLIGIVFCIGYYVWIRKYLCYISGASQD